MTDKVIFENAEKLIDEARRVFDNHAFAAGFYKSLALSMMNHIDDSNRQRYARYISETLDDLQNGKFGK